MYISVCVICIIALIVFSILGNKTRIGYISELDLNIYDSLLLNGFNIYATKKLFTTNNIKEKIIYM